MYTHTHEYTQVYIYCFCLDWDTERNVELITMAKDIFLLLPLRLLQVSACDTCLSLISFFSSHLLARGNSQFLDHLVEKLWQFLVCTAESLSSFISIPRKLPVGSPFEIQAEPCHHLNGFSRACDDSSWSMALVDNLLLPTLW